MKKLYCPTCGKQSVEVLFEAASVEAGEWLRDLETESLNKYAQKTYGTTAIDFNLLAYEDEWSGSQFKCRSCQTCFVAQPMASSDSTNAGDRLAIENALFASAVEEVECTCSIETPDDCSCTNKEKFCRWLNGNHSGERYLNDEQRDHLISDVVSYEECRYQRGELEAMTDAQLATAACTIGAPKNIPTASPLWTKIGEMQIFVKNEIRSNPATNFEDHWVNFDETTEINIFQEENYSPTRHSAVAYPIEDGNINTMSGYVRIF